MEKEEIGIWKKIIINDFVSGNGNIFFFEVGKFIEYKEKNRILIIIYFDL